MRKKQAPFEIPTILESLAMDVTCGNLTMEQAANELHCANWTPYVDIERTERLLAPYMAKEAEKQKGS